MALSHAPKRILLCPPPGHMRTPPSAGEGLPVASLATTDGRWLDRRGGARAVAAIVPGGAARPLARDFGGGVAAAVRPPRVCRPGRARAPRRDARGRRGGAGHAQVRRPLRPPLPAAAGGRAGSAADNAPDAAGERVVPPADRVLHRREPRRECHSAVLRRAGQPVRVHGHAGARANEGAVQGVQGVVWEAGGFGTLLERLFWSLHDR